MRFGNPRAAANPAAASRPRVLVPRAGEPGDRLADALRHAGFEPRIVPLISFLPPTDTEPLETGLRDLAAGAFDWLILTSERTVDALVAHSTIPPGGLCAHVHVAAVGPSTARRAANAGIAVDVVPNWEKSACGLVMDLAARRPARAFVPHSDIARPELAAGLRAAGWRVTTVDAYRTVTATTLPAAVTEVDVVLLTSSSTATTWAALRDPEHDPLYVSIGPRTTETATELGLPIAATAPEPTSESLAETLTSLAHLLPTTRRP